MADEELSALLGAAGTDRGDLVALAARPGVGLGLATARGSWALAWADPRGVIEPVERSIGPRWVLWSRETALELAGSGVRLARAWDLAAVHRLLFGGSAAECGRLWAGGQGLDPEALPTAAPHDLFSSITEDGDDPEEPVRADGHLRPEWTAGGWGASPSRLRRWAELGLQVAVLQHARLAELGAHPLALSTARSESVAELLCAEMTADGLPMDRATAEEILAGFVGNPAGSDEAEVAGRAARRRGAAARSRPG